jgi:hypothetical protein
MIFLVGAYRFQLPYWAEVKVKPFIPPEDNFGEGSTLWEFVVGSFSFHLHLEATGRPEDLGGFILSCTKERVDLEPVEINGIRGVTYGSYEQPGGCSIEWWLKKGELMICISLLGRDEQASEEDRKTHREIMASLSHVAA